MAFQPNAFHTNAFQEGTAGGGSPDLTIALSGIAATASAGILIPTMAIPLVGTAATASVGTLIPTFSIALTGSAAAGSAGTLTYVAEGEATTVTGGWAAFNNYAIRRRELLQDANRRKQEAIEEAKDDAVQKELARRLHAELARQDEIDQLGRLRSLVSENSYLTNADNRLQTAFLKAKSERTFSRLQALQRELIKAQEEEEMAVLMILLADD